MADRISPGSPGEPPPDRQPPSGRPAGWYLDEQSQHQWRWWDGAAWTRHTAPRWSPVTVDRRRIRPRAWWFGLAALPAALGVAGAVLLVIAAVDAGSRAVSHLTAPLVPLQAPGSATVNLRAGDTRTIYTPTTPPGAGPPSPGSADLRCQVSGPGGPAPPPSINEGATLEQGSSHYRSLFDFTAPGGGATRVTCRPTAGGGALSLAIGPHIEVGEILGIVARAFGAFGALVLGFGVGGGLGVLVGVMRDRSERRLREESSSTPPAA